MTIQIDRANDAALNVGKSQSSQRVMGQVKIWGQTVTVNKCRTAYLEAAQEELSFAVAGRIDRKKSLKKAISSYEHDPFERALEIKVESILSRMPDLEREFHYKMAGRLDANGLSAEQIMARLRALIPDPSRRYVVLLKLLKDMAYGKMEFLVNVDDSEELKRFIKRELGDLWDDHGHEVRAGINIAQATKLFVGESDLDNLGKLRNLYYDAVLDFGGISKTFQKILQHGGEKAFASNLLFLIKALIDDLNAFRSSIEKSRLEAIMRDIRLLKSLDTIKEKCGILGKRLKIEISNFKVLGVLLQLTEGDKAPGVALRDLMHQVGVLGLPDKIYFLQQVKEIIRLMPEMVFKISGGKQRSCDDIQVVLDEYIFEEEKMEEA